METTNNNRPMLIDGLSCVCGYNKIYYYRINVDGVSDVNQLACPNCGIIMRSPNTDENGEWLKKHWKKTHETPMAERDEYFERDNMCSDDMLNEVLEIVEAFSSIDAKPVRHGRWIYDPNANDWNIGGYVCSECHTRNNNLPCNEIANTLIYAGSKFCPHCGARMDEETDDDYRHDHQ